MEFVHDRVGERTRIWSPASNRPMTSQHKQRQTRRPRCLDAARLDSLRAYKSCQLHARLPVLYKCGAPGQANERVACHAQTRGPPPDRRPTIHCAQHRFSLCPPVVIAALIALRAAVVRPPPAP